MAIQKFMREGQAVFHVKNVFANRAARFINFTANTYDGE
jgi:hypothetical protein